MDEKKALAKVMQLCSRKEYCISEITNKLKKWEISDIKAETILATLKKEKFIDERRYADYFVHDKIWINKWGKIKVQYQLKLKGIPEVFIINAFKKVDKNKYEKMICDEIEKKNKNIKAKSKFETKSKLMNFAMNRGYESETIYKCINRIAYK